jgi:DNA-binding IscR family transcriptional regulator
MSNLQLRAVSAHVLRHLARENSRGRAVHLEELASDIGVRREDIRHVVSSLHREGHVDARRMRLTMTGLALAAAMKDCTLRAVRLAAERPSTLNVA